jgi:hypothetical protein
MNRRQAKKAFKKKYGINPNKFEKAISKIDTTKLLDSLAAAAAKMFELMKQWAKEYNERIEEIGFQATQIELEEKMAKLAEKERK